MRAELRGSVDRDELDVEDEHAGGRAGAGVLAVGEGRRDPEAALLADDPNLEIRIAIDKEARTLAITDNGIGLSREEAISHLGTIARSGTAQFVQQLSGDQRKDSQLIGQFGVGFYSAFMVADRVEVFSRRAGLEAAAGVR